MTDDPTGTHRLPFTIYVCVPHERDEASSATAILLTECQDLARSCGFRFDEGVIWNDLGSGIVSARILEQVRGCQTAMFMVNRRPLHRDSCGCARPSQQAVYTCIPEEPASDGPGDYERETRALISKALVYAKGAGFRILTHRNDSPGDPDRWLRLFWRQPNCLMIVSPLGPVSSPPAIPPPAAMELPEQRPVQDTRAEHRGHPNTLDRPARLDDLEHARREESEAPTEALHNRAHRREEMSHVHISGAFNAIPGPLNIGRLPQSGRPSHPRPPDVPERARDHPLPHDGLFIRRNNAFGTKSTVGVADLIEQGVLIDQTQIRFDDFIASRTDGIPSPPTGEAIAVSHGCATTPGDSKAYLATTHFLEIALRAADEPSDLAPHGEPLPVNFAFVVDTSSSMSGEKLDTVKASLRHLYEQLRDIDILAIVTFDTQVRTALKATRKADLPHDHLTSIVSRLHANGATDLNLGVLYGIDEIGRYAQDRSDLVNCLYFFSDGAPTSGETNWIKIRSNIAARLRGDLTLSCFGFGSDAQIRELEALAGTAGGHFTFVAQPEDVQLNLKEDLTRREHLAAINVQLQIEIDPQIRIWHLYGHDLVTDPVVRESVIRDAQGARRMGEEQFGTQALPDLITKEKGIRIFAPDLVSPN